jgi:hypothetical protein
VTDSPFFLAGVDRSGIGLLGEVLERHPNLAISRRTNFWPLYYRRFGDLSRPENLERCVASLMRYRRIRDLGIDRVALIEQMHRGEPSYGRLLAAIEEQNLRRLGKIRWGDKSLGSEGHANTILREFPEARFVHVMRDPRDRYASQATHRRAARGKVGSGTAIWLWSAKLAERNRDRLGDRYLVIRYEDLVADPPETLRGVCRFLGEEFHPDMLSTAAGDLTTSSVGRFRRDLDRRDLAFVQTVAGGTMRRLGYVPEADEMPPLERIRFVLFGLPVGLARMGGWWLGRAVGSLARPIPSDRRLVDA